MNKYKIFRFKLKYKLFFAELNYRLLKNIVEMMEGKRRFNDIDFGGLKQYTQEKK